MQLLASSHASLDARAGQIPANRELHQARQVVDIEFAHQAGAVGVDGFRTQLQARGDLLVPQSFDQEAEHLVLARTQTFQRVFPSPVSIRSQKLVQFDVG